MQWLTDPQSWIALLTLTSLEIVLGIDNIVFISILANKLPAEQRGQARIIGLGLAMLMRIGLLFSISWIIGLSTPLFSVLDYDISGRDLILMAGGLFLLAKSTLEIHAKLEGNEEEERSADGAASLGGTLIQIMLLDVVFSLDSVITAVGMANRLGIMVAAIVIAVLFMMLFSKPISDFVQQHPTVKMLALSFLLLIGVALVADGLHTHIPRGYIYFAMGFSVFVEMLNLRVRQARAPVIELRRRYH